MRLALDNFGVSQKLNASNTWILNLSRLNFISEIFLLSIRNVFRQRTRLIMTLGLLAAGGAMFMTALNISDAWEANVKRIYTQRLFDLEVKLNKTISTDSALSVLQNISGVSRMEGANTSSTAFVKENQYEIVHTYLDKGHGSFTMQAIPVSTKLFNLTITEGMWLSEENSNDVVLNQMARGLSPGVKIGTKLFLPLRGYQQHGESLDSVRMWERPPRHTFR